MKYARYVISILLICIMILYGFKKFKYLYVNENETVEAFKPINVIYRPFLRNVNNAYTQVFIRPQIHLSNYFRKLQII